MRGWQTTTGEDCAMEHLETSLASVDQSCRPCFHSLRPAQRTRPHFSFWYLYDCKCVLGFWHICHPYTFGQSQRTPFDNAICISCPLCDNVYLHPPLFSGASGPFLFGIYVEGLGNTAYENLWNLLCQARLILPFLAMWQMVAPSLFLSIDE